MKRLLLALAPLVLTISCAADPTPSTDATASPGPATSPPSTTPGPASPTPEELVHRDGAVLASVRVVRTGPSTDVASLWSVRSGGRHQYVLARSDDSFATGTYERVSQQRGLAATAPRPDGAPRFGGCSDVAGGTTVCDDRGQRITWTDGSGAWASTDVADLDGFSGLMVSPAGSLASNTFAAVGGGDGATLFPFSRVARSTDAGATWTSAGLPTFDGATAYVSGQVVLPDGRLLAGLTHFSDDRRNAPASRSHGLWVSDGDDWSSLTAYTPRFVPALPAIDDGQIASVGVGVGPDPLVLVTLEDGRVYGSPDGVRPFREIAVR